MKRRWSTHKVIIAALVCAGCSEATGPYFKEASAPPPGRGLVYIYQMPGTASMLSTTRIVMDGKPIAMLHNNCYTTLYLPLGSHAIAETSQGISNAASMSVEMTIASGATIYVGLGSPLIRQSDGTWKYVTTFEIKPPELARMEILRRQFEPADNPAP